MGFLDGLYHHAVHKIRNTSNTTDDLSSMQNFAYNNEEPSQENEDPQVFVQRMLARILGQQI